MNLGISVKFHIEIDRTVMDHLPNYHQADQLQTSHPYTYLYVCHSFIRLFNIVAIKREIIIEKVKTIIKVKLHIRVL